MKSKIYTAQMFKDGKIFFTIRLAGSERKVTDALVDIYRPCTIQIYAGLRSRSFPRKKWIKEVIC